MDATAAGRRRYLADSINHQLGRFTPEEGSTRNLGTWIPRTTGWRTYLPFVPEEEWRMQQRA
jgi:hypothetical protein